MIPTYYPNPCVAETECLALLNEWADEDRDRRAWLESKINQIITRMKTRRAKSFGRVQAAELLYKMIERGYYPRGE